jgi:Flp pilus assembly protein TadD
MVVGLSQPALGPLRRATELNAGRADAWSRLAYALLATRQQDEADRAAARALALAPADTSARYVRAMLQLERGAAGEGARQYLELLRDNPEDPGLWADFRRLVRQAGPSSPMAIETRAAVTRPAFATIAPRLRSLLP